MEKSISCLLVDDEPLARNLLERYIDRVPFLTLLSSCSNAVDALKKVSEEKPDLLLLDVQMPELTGLNLLDILVTNRPQVILTTAYSQYALDGFEYNVTDYLLKPIRFERFLRAIYKVRSQLTTGPEREIRLDKTGNQLSASQIATDHFIWLTIDKTKVQVNSQEILFIESFKDYISIHLSGQTLIVRLPLQKLEQILPACSFIRIHRSYLVRRSAILAVDAVSIELINKKQLPIGITYRESIRKSFNRF